MKRDNLINNSKLPDNWHNRKNNQKNNQTPICNLITKISSVNIHTHTQNTRARTHKSPNKDFERSRTRPTTNDCI